VADLEHIMNTSARITDIEFLKLSGWKQRHCLYVYQQDSGLFRSAVRTKIAASAAREGRKLKNIATYEKQEADKMKQQLPSIRLTVIEVSLFEDTLTIIDLGDPTMKRLPLNDLEQALFLIANDAAEQSLCLMVPHKHGIVGTEAWGVAVESVGLIEEPMANVENYRAIGRHYFPQSRLGNLQHLSDDRRFLTRLRQFVEKSACTPFALSMRIDLIVLTEMDGGKFRDTGEPNMKRRDRFVLPEILRRFLDNRDASSFSALMLLTDRLRNVRTLEQRELLTRLYRATSRTLELADRRYRRSEDPAHIIWGALLLANERSFLCGNAIVAMDNVCQQYGRAAREPAWFSSHEGWEVLAPLLDLGISGGISRLDVARLELRLALRARLLASRDERLNWFHRQTLSVDAKLAMDQPGQYLQARVAGETRI
jgi:hypothetical protein